MVCSVISTSQSAVIHPTLFLSVCLSQGSHGVFCHLTSQSAVICPTGTFKVNNVTPQANGESSKVKVKVRINGNGILTISGATLYEKMEGEEEKEESMDVDGEEDKKDGAGLVSNGTPEEVGC